MTELAAALKVIHDAVKENFRPLMFELIDMDEYEDDEISDEEIAGDIAEGLYHKFGGQIEKAVEEARRLGRSQR